MVRPIHGLETFSDKNFCYRHLSTFFQSATTSCIPKRPNNVEHGLRVPHLSKRRRDRGQRFVIPERSFERHKVGSSPQTVRVFLGISAREQAGVMTDLAQDPTLVRRLYAALPLAFFFFVGA